MNPATCKYLEVHYDIINSVLKLVLHHQNIFIRRTIFCNQYLTLRQRNNISMKSKGEIMQSIILSISWCSAYMKDSLMLSPYIWNTLVKSFWYFLYFKRTPCLSVVISQSYKHFQCQCTRVYVHACARACMDSVSHLLN